MSEIEKMYKNANVEDKNIDNQLYKDLNYPQFTAEKQLLLLQMLARKYGKIHIINNSPKEISIGIEGISFNLKDFGETIAMVLNTFWQDLTEKEKQQVKGILE